MVWHLIAEKWRFALNDPSLIGWVVAVTYLAVGGGCFCAWRASKKPLGGDEGRGWLLLASALVFLGLNKQLDFHSLLVDLHGTWIKEHLVMLLCAVVAAGLLGLFAFRNGIRAMGASERWALACLGGLLFVVGSRFLPYAGIGGLLESHVMGLEKGILHVHLVEVFELGFLVLIGWIGVRFLKQMKRNQMQESRVGHERTASV